MMMTTATKRFITRLDDAKRAGQSESGQVLVQTVILLPMMMILVGLVLDGGWMYWQYRRSEIAVNTAAQAASHAIDVDYFRETNQVRLDQGAAWDAASGFLNINQRGQMQVSGIFIGNNQVVVDANAQAQTIFFRLAGISTLSMRVQGRAYPAFGINRENQ
jgi:Flp pilus assembly protein TadG